MDAPEGLRGVLDPDVRALVCDDAEGRDPYAIVQVKAEALLARLDDFSTDSLSPLDRMRALAGLAGLPIRPATQGMSTRGRAAMYVPGQGGDKTYIVYDSTLPVSRIVFSLGHEIAHSFIPNSQAGVRFRSTTSGASKAGRQLEMLCEFGASILTMPPREFEMAVRRVGFGLEHVQEVRRSFGTSFEAATYRMAQTAKLPAGAVKLRFRLSRAQQQAPPRSGFLFPVPDASEAKPKYRCQSFHRSQSLGGIIPYNKSFSEDSCVYQAAKSGRLETAVEVLPIVGGSRIRAVVQAMPALFQPADVDVNHPDILVLFRVDPQRL